ncbi:hypothetical protein H4582DRAFT_2054115 [Lactarius indigo]|nr:hypothetical protein H4582DRAFT_2054115 [Lactarius indigo]
MSGFGVNPAIKRPFLCVSSFGPLRHVSITPLFSLAGGCKIPGATRASKDSYTPQHGLGRSPVRGSRVLIHDLRLAMMLQSQVPRFFSGKARGGAVLSLSSTENRRNTQEGFLVRTQQLKKRSFSRGRWWVSYGNIMSSLGCSLLPANFVSSPGFRVFSSLERRTKGFHRGQ